MTDCCINCGEEIEDDGIYAMSGLEVVEGDGTSEGLELEPVMDDGPYCSLDCSIQSDGGETADTTSTGTEREGDDS